MNKQKNIKTLSKYENEYSKLIYFLGIFGKIYIYFEVWLKIKIYFLYYLNNYKFIKIEILYSKISWSNF